MAPISVVKKEGKNTKKGATNKKVVGIGQKGKCKVTARGKELSSESDASSEKLVTEAPMGGDCIARS